MVLLDEQRIDAAISKARFYFLLGVAMFVACAYLPEDLKVPFTAFTTFQLGIYPLALRAWRTDPGLWMLAGFLTFFIGSIYLFFEYEKLMSLLGQPPPGVFQPRFGRLKSVVFAADSTLALILYARVVRFAASVAVLNWKLTRSGMTKELISPHCRESGGDLDCLNEPW